MQHKHTHLIPLRTPQATASTTWSRALTPPLTPSSCSRRHPVPTLETPPSSRPTTMTPWARLEILLWCARSGRWLRVVGLIPGRCMRVELREGADHPRDGRIPEVILYDWAQYFLRVILYMSVLTQTIIPGKNWSVSFEYRPSVILPCTCLNASGAEEYSQTSTRTPWLESSHVRAKQCQHNQNMNLAIIWLDQRKHRFIGVGPWWNNHSILILFV